jgi:hypothetical protein
MVFLIKDEKVKKKKKADEEEKTNPDDGHGNK